MALMLPLLEMGGHNTWEMPQLPSYNKLPPRSTLIPYPTSQDALLHDRVETPWFSSLNDDWDFNILPRPEDVTSETIEGGHSSSIQAPGNWTMQGFGHPHYTNIVMPFPNLPTDVPGENPTGVYR